MASSGLVIPWCLQLQRLLTVQRRQPPIAEVYEPPQLCLPSTRISPMQLQMLLRLEIHIAQGLGLLPYSSALRLKPLEQICNSRASQCASSWGTIDAAHGIELSPCTPDRLHKICDAKRSALFAFSFHEVWHFARDLRICIFSSSSVGTPRPLRAACQYTSVSLTS